MQNSETVLCFSCGAMVPNIEGPIHKYMLSTPGCWKLYGEILAKEYTQLNYDPDSHRITVDAYAVTHPGVKDERRAVQSVNIHLIRMHYQFEKNCKGEKLLQIIKNAAENTELHQSFTWLEPPSFINAPNITSVLFANNIKEHKERVYTWGTSIWTLWKNIHGDKIAQLVNTLQI
jgi:hypothetical protein